MAEAPRGNFQVRMLAGEENLTAAISALDKMAVVGLTERLSLSLAMVRSALGWPTMACSRPGKVNASTDVMRASTKAIALKHMDEIASANELDIALYKYASETLWPRQVEALGCESSEASGNKLTKALYRVTYLGYRHVVHLPLTRVQGRLARASP